MSLRGLSTCHFRVVHETKAFGVAGESVPRSGPHTCLDFLHHREALAAGEKDSTRLVDTVGHEENSGALDPSTPRAARNSHNSIENTQDHTHLLEPGLLSDSIF